MNLFICLPPPEGKVRESKQLDFIFYCCSNAQKHTLSKTRKEKTQVSTKSKTELTWINELIKCIQT